MTRRNADPSRGTRSGAISGSVHMYGTDIVRADLNVRFPNLAKRPPLKTSLDSPVGWTIPQLRSARNFLQLALREVDDYSVCVQHSNTGEQVGYVSCNAAHRCAVADLCAPRI